MSTNKVMEVRKESENKTIKVTAPNIRLASFNVIGTAPLVTHRFSHKVKMGMIAKMEKGNVGKKEKAKHEPMTTDAKFEEARYISKEGWDGFNASGIRNAMVSACRLVNFKMTMGKLSLFVVPDGWDALEPEIPLVRIYGKPRKMETRANVETGQAYISVRPCYDKWSADVKIRFDADQFSIDDVSNLLARVGMQVGIGEGRPDSKNSMGMGWGTFRIAEKEDDK